MTEQQIKYAQITLNYTYEIIQQWKNNTALSADIVQLELTKAWAKYDGMLTLLGDIGYNVIASTDHKHCIYEQ